MNVGCECVNVSVNVKIETFTVTFTEICPFLTLGATCDGQRRYKQRGALVANLLLECMEENARLIVKKREWLSSKIIVKNRLPKCN